MQTLLNVEWVESWEKKRENQKHGRRESLEGRLETNNRIGKEENLD